jgi:PmbA protein
VAERLRDPEEAAQVASDSVAAARAAGADAAEVFVRTGPLQRLTWRGAELAVEARGRQCEVLVRAWRRGRSLAVTATHLTGELRELARAAAAAAGSQGEELTPCLRPGPEVLLLPAAPIEQREDPGESLAGALAEVASLPALRGAQLTAVCTSGRQWNVLANSLGLVAGYESVQQVAWLWADWPGGRLAEAVSGGGAAAVLAAGRRLAELAPVLRAEPQRGPGDSASVLLAPGVAAHVARALGDLLTGDNLAHGLRALVELRGRSIASSAIDLVDSPTRPDAMRTRPIDDEGTPTRDVPLLRKGRLAGVLHTLRSAGELGEEPTGSAYRPALWRPPAAGPSNVRIEPGGGSPAALREAMGAGIEVLGLGRPGRIQEGTGNFTLTAHGWFVEAGERMAPAVGVPLSANVFELLRRVRACGDDFGYAPLADGAGAPSLLLERMRIG